MHVRAVDDEVVRDHGERGLCLGTVKGDEAEVLRRRRRHRDFETGEPVVVRGQRGGDHVQVVCGDELGQVELGRDRRRHARAFGRKARVIGRPNDDPVGARRVLVWQHEVADVRGAGGELDHVTGQRAVDRGLQVSTGGDGDDLAAGSGRQRRYRIEMHLRQRGQPFRRLPHVLLGDNWCRPRGRLHGGHIAAGATRHHHNSSEPEVPDHRHVHFHVRGIGEFAGRIDRQDPVEPRRPPDPRRIHHVVKYAVTIRTLLATSLTLVEWLVLIFVRLHEQREQHILHKASLHRTVTARPRLTPPAASATPPAESSTPPHSLDTVAPSAAYRRHPAHQSACP